MIDWIYKNILVCDVNGENITTTNLIGVFLCELAVRRNYFKKLDTNKYILNK